MKVGDLVRETHAWTPLGDLVKVKNEGTYLVLKSRQDIESGAFVIQSIKSGIKHIICTKGKRRHIMEVINESR